MTQYLNPLSGSQFVDANGAPYSGAKLFIYSAGSTSKVTTTKDQAGSSNHTNPIILSSKGEIADGSGNRQALWQPGGTTVKMVLAPSTDTDPPTSPYWTIDNVAGINDASASVDQWVSGPTPTYVSTTSFTLVGDQTSTFHVGRRLKLSISAGTVYGTILTTTYTTLTTIVVTLDSGVLDSGLTSVYYGLISSTNDSLPRTQTGNYTMTGSIAASTTGTTNTFSITSTDQGAALHEAIKLDRNSSSPAASDILNGISFAGRNLSAGSVNYGQIQAEIVDATASAEKGKLSFNTTYSGALATRGYISAGAVLGAPTGGDMGVGTINATGFYVNGVALSYAVSLPTGTQKLGSQTMTQGATRYIGALGQTDGTTEVNYAMYCPYPITVKNLYIKLNANVPASQTVTFTVRRNGVATGVTVTIGAGSSTGSDTSDIANFDTGDYITIQYVTSASFTNTISCAVSFQALIYGTTVGAPVQFFNMRGYPGATTHAGWDIATFDSIGADINFDTPLNACAQTSIRVFAADTTSLRLKRNQSTVTTIFSATGSDTDANIYASGDLAELADGNAGSGGSAGAITFGSNLDRTVNLYHPICFAAQNQTQGTTVYAGGCGAAATRNTTESVVQWPAPCSGTIKNLLASTDTTPTAGQTITITARKNGSDTTMTCQITSAGRSASDTTHTFTVVAGDLISIKVVSSASVGTRYTNMSLEFVQ